MASLLPKTHTQSMPPPPVPVLAQGIMAPEARALSGSLKVGIVVAMDGVCSLTPYVLPQTAAVKTGQLYRFYADTKRL